MFGIQQVSSDGLTSSGLRLYLGSSAFLSASTPSSVLDPPAESQDQS